MIRDLEYHPSLLILPFSGNVEVFHLKFESYVMWDGHFQ